MNDDLRRRAASMEFWATIVMALAAVLTAWSAFQSSKWSGVQAIAFSEASAARTESTRSTSVAAGQVNVDVTTFVEWRDRNRLIALGLGGVLLAVTASVVVTFPVEI